MAADSRQAVRSQESLLASDRGSPARQQARVAGAGKAGPDPACLPPLVAARFTAAPDSQ